MRTPLLNSINDTPAEAGCRSPRLCCPMRGRRGPLAFRRFFFRPVEVHDDREWPLGAQPVGFFVLAWRFALHNRRQPAVRVALKLRQHRRIEGSPMYVKGTAAAGAAGS